MSQPTRPLPGLDEPDTREFWSATVDHELRYQTCEGCSAVVFHPRSHCTSCLSGRLRWNVSRGEGAVYSWSTVRQSYHPFFRTRVPYAVAWIDLDEGFRMLSNVVGVEDPTRDLRVGQRVRVTWEDHDEVAVPLFEPIEA